MSDRIFRSKASNKEDLIGKKCFNFSLFRSIKFAGIKQGFLPFPQ